MDGQMDNRGSSHMVNVLLMVVMSPLPTSRSCFDVLDLRLLGGWTKIKHIPLKWWFKVIYHGRKEHITLNKSKMLNEHEVSGIKRHPEKLTLVNAY